MQADILREKFLKFFEAKGHKIVESDSLVPKDDPTVLFTPAGMNQFKKEFLGFESGFKRAATSQRCLRTDDLDKVGKTSAHHTFFEMLGNFSFGDYFKKEAISWAWEFLTEELKISADKLWVSVYKDDDEAYEIWLRQVGIPEKRIVRLGDKDNFWPAEAKLKGPNGPCGPCSEIFFDFGIKAGCGKPDCTPACGCGRFVEVWNLVFTQFNRNDDGTLTPLPNKNIDTGMGLERLTAVMEGKLNNFETELFQPLIKEVLRGLSLKVPAADKKMLYAIADHARAIVFSIYDGIFPSNEGRGYVVRKIIRKTVSHLRALGTTKPFIHSLVPLVAQIMYRPYPHLKAKQEDIAQVILNEENNFINTLSMSGFLVGEEIEKASSLLEKDPKAGGYILAGSSTSGALGIAGFRLYDTNGIPAEITKEELFKRNIKVNDNFDAAFQSELEKQKNLSKSSSKMKGDVFDFKGLGLKVADTKFTGYKEYSSKAKILIILKEGREIKEASAGAGDILQIVLDQTPFYAESGGQVGDTGELESEGNIFQVLDTKKVDNVFLHSGKIKSGFLRPGDIVTAKINAARRLSIARNHTATHIIQAALRKVLGTHVQQQGSLVGEERLRFDFTHFKALTKDEIIRVEELANGFVKDGYSVNCKEMPLKEAKDKGALAFFEEKYGETVRVVTVEDISNELCGGTHLNNIKEVGIIKIISEGSVASGIRRIEAVTAGFAERFIELQEEKAIEEIKRKNKLEEIKAQEKKRAEETVNIINNRIENAISKSVKLNKVNAIFLVEEDLDMQGLRAMADALKTKVDNAVIALASGDKNEEKACLVIAITSDLLVKGVDAGVLIREVAPLIGGKGGGRKDFAQAGGNKPDNFRLAFDKLKSIIEKLG